MLLLNAERAFFTNQIDAMARYIIDRLKPNEIVSLSQSEFEQIILSFSVALFGCRIDSDWLWAVISIRSYRLVHAARESIASTTAHSCRSVITKYGTTVPQASLNRQLLPSPNHSDSSISTLPSMAIYCMPCNNNNNNHS